jgi:ribosome maturation factor RimP
MSVDPVVERVWEMVSSVVADEGMEVVDIEFRPEGSRGGRVLRLYLDKEGGPTVDDLTRVSRQLSERLDDSPEVPGPYTLEVSSPGINRALKRVEHFARYVDKKVRVRTRDMIEGRKSFLGVLKEVTQDEIVVAQDGREFHIALSQIEKANYEHEWGK